MNFVEFYLMERKLPPGFSIEDIETVGEFIKDELGKSASEEEVTDADVQKVDIDALKALRLDPKKQKEFQKTQKLGLADRPQKMLHTSNIVDENGNLIDNDALRKKISQRPANLIGQNEKLSKSGIDATFFDFTIPAYQGLYVDESTGEFKVVRTCPAAGICKKFCYASKGGYIQFPPSSLSSTRMINYIMNDYEGFKSQMIRELEKAVKYRARVGKKVILRWHDAGDFLSEKYFDMVMDIAKATPNVLHYTYTKQIPLLKQKQVSMPPNFKITMSMGGIYDDLIDKEKDTFADVVPPELFKDLKFKKKGEANNKFGNGTGKLFADEDIKVLKKRIAEHFKINNEENIITYDEMQKIKDEGTKKYYVLVWSGHGDDAGARSDVKGIFLFFH